jgi:hypothetical protein
MVLAIATFGALNWSIDYFAEHFGRRFLALDWLGDFWCRKHRNAFEPILPQSLEVKDGIKDEVSL